MRKISDMPKGGGGDRGRTVWFSLVTDDGVEHSFEIDHLRLDLLLRGLRLFSNEAANLRKVNGEGAGGNPIPVAEKVRSRLAANGDLQMAIGLKHQEIVQFAVPRAGVKAMIDEMGRAIARAPKSAPQRPTPTTASNG